MFSKITRGKFQIPPSSGLSLDAKILLRSLIRLKPEERLLPDEILSHNWLKQDSAFSNQLRQNKFKNLNSAYNYLNGLNTNPINIFNNNNIFHHKPLGISRSSPMTQSPPLIISKSSDSLITTPKIDSDRMVPEFQQSNELEKKI